MLSRAAAAQAVLLALLIVPAAAVTGPAPAHADLVRDEQYPLLRTLEAEKAWQVTRGRGALVAVVDSGVDAAHPDLKRSVTSGPNLIEKADRGTRPTRRHGTAMASLIAGHGHGPGGRDGIIGLAPEARVLAIRAVAEPEDGGYRAYQSDERAQGALVEGIKTAVDRGADVINLSLGNYRAGADERAAVAYAIARDVVVVAAVGNDGDDRRKIDSDGFAPYFYPASFPGVIAVAATGADHERAVFSNRNYSVLVSAPGTRVPVAVPGGEYALTGGTSDAAALVSGIAALIRSRHPKLEPALVAQALQASTRHQPSGTYDPSVGFGEVSAARALAEADALTAKARRADAGKAGGLRFGASDTAATTVIHRPWWLSLGLPILTAAGVAGTAGGGFATVLLYRRDRRDRRDSQDRGDVMITRPAGPAPAEPG